MRGQQMHVRAGGTEALLRPSPPTKDSSSSSGGPSLQGRSRYHYSPQLRRRRCFWSGVLRTGRRLEPETGSALAMHPGLEQARRAPSSSPPPN